MQRLRLYDMFRPAAGTEQTCMQEPSATGEPSAVQQAEEAIQRLKLADSSARSRSSEDLWLAAQRTKTLPLASRPPLAAAALQGLHLADSAPRSRSHDDIAGQARAAIVAH